MATQNSTPTSTTNKPARTRQPKPTPANSLTASRGGAAPILGSVPATTAATPVIVPTLTPTHLPPLVIDRNNTGNYTTRHGRYDPTEIEGDLIRFLVDGELPIMEHDAPKAVAYMMGEGGGATLADVFTSSLKYRAARRQLCANLARYIEAVNEDEARRDSLEGQTQPAATTAQTSAQTRAALANYYQSSPDKSTTYSDNERIATDMRSQGIAVTEEGERTKEQPTRMSAELWEKAGRVEEQRLIGYFNAANPTDRGRIFDFANECAIRATAADSHRVGRENAALIAAEMADALRFDDYPEEIGPDYEPGNQKADFTRIYHLTPSEADAIEAAALSLYNLPAISYGRTETPTEEPTGKTEARATADNLLHELDGLFGKITRMSDAGGGKICLESEALEEITSDFSDALPDLTGGSNNSMYSIIAAILYGNSFSDYAARVGPSIARDTAEWTLSIGQVYLRAMATGNTYVANLLHLVNAYAAKEMDSGDEE